ncbi:YgaP family membrane protein [Halococcoides cellulosivorans]|uniref:DUF2892 domain-containing protein n=1 Tax=Halococcoides cellulosivorans TaxID=1679096 RepID=A0A2R4X4J5_9EURY|nr:DUF2892 domain-containing protein [Halococcoides cellulosivorans]AWB28716.1 DUF2892 domain-containing protein [Halococcoides cellulosivorans]
MNHNVGQTDRIVRIAAGLVAVIVAVVVAMGVAGLGSPVDLVVAAVVGLIGLVLIGTGVTQTCALYSLIGVDTSD